MTLTRNGKDEITNYNDPRSLNTSFVRNGFGDVIQRGSPDTGITVYTYNALGKPTQITDGRGVVTNPAYDNAGRLLSKQYPAATVENITYTWDATAGGNRGVGRLTRIDDASGSVEWTYNVLGQVTAEKKTTLSMVYNVAYAYDLDGNVMQITYPSGRIVNFSRDTTGRVTAVTTGGGTPATLASGVGYLPFGPLRTLTYGNGLILNRTFNQDYNLTALKVAQGTTSVVDYGYGYGNGDFSITGIADNVGAVSGGVAAATETLSYPASSNLLGTVTSGATTLRSFAYDGAGNVITDTRGSAVYQYRYNNRGRLDQLTAGSTVAASYGYDGLERMSVRTTQNMTPAATTHYVYDRAGRLLMEASSTGTIQREYVWLDDMPLALFADLDTTSPKQWYVHADHLNRPIKMTDASQAVVWDAQYWPFGEVRLITGSASNNLRFPGQYFLVESGLHYNWYRHYDPTIGRYVQPDHLGFIDGPNVFQYASGNPVNYADPRGEFAFVPILVGVGAGLAFDYAVSEYKRTHCSCQDASTSGGPWGNGAAGGANGAFGPFGAKPRTGISGGGPPGMTTSPFSQAVGDSYNADLIGLGTRNALRGAGKVISKSLPWGTAALAAWEIYDALSCR
ncbi:RHS repeat-associated core domain-containing protein [Bradyrhizobium oropedii]|uniref:RHS repeat-associated core domain-containing protein n=1 Tax=Bradyrhizobium oropedii TaxID=1571201 RepID=UPI003084039A